MDFSMKWLGGKPVHRVAYERAIKAALLEAYPQLKNANVRVDVQRRHQVGVKSWWQCLGVWRDNDRLDESFCDLVEQVLVGR